jgi:hypothetical protein
MRSAKLQLLGPLAVATIVIAAEATAYLLAVSPTSPLVWYLNIEVFGIFQRSHYILSDRIPVPFLQLTAVALPLLLLVCCGLAWRRPLLVAAASNFSLLYVLFLVYAWHLVATPPLTAASLGPSWLYAAVPWSAFKLNAGPHLLLLSAMLTLSLLSSCASHAAYLRAIRKS